METLELQSGREPAGTVTAARYQTLELVSLVREARLQAVDTRQQAGKVIALVARTTVQVHRTRRQTAQALARRRRAARSGAAARERAADTRAPRAAVPDQAAGALAGPGRPESLPATLRRAVAFIDGHAREDLSTADIAAAACVAVRTLQLAFRRHLGTTPTQYLRRVRLDHAHRDLIAADPDRDSVTAVAYRWGFASASRFASYYHGAYGVVPSRTLHSGSPSGTS